MSLSAKNSLLKVTEEPPMDAYFVIPLEDVGNTLPTIKSRSIELQMEPYTREQLEIFMNGKFPNHELCLEIANNPGELLELKEMGVDNLVGHVDTVIDNVYDVSSGNALNIANLIKFKDEDEGFGLDVFWRVFNNRIENRLKSNVASYTMSETKVLVEWMRITQKYLNFSNSPSLNKRMLFDMWIFDIRNEVR